MVLRQARHRQDGRLGLFGEPRWIMCKLLFASKFYYTYKRYLQIKGRLKEFKLKSKIAIYSVQCDVFQ